MLRGNAAIGYRNPGIGKLPSSRYFFSIYEPLHLFAMAAAVCGWRPRQIRPALTGVMGITKGNMHEYFTGKSSRNELGCKAGKNADVEITSHNGCSSDNPCEEHAPWRSKT
jgi:hypothetical protein